MFGKAWDWAKEHPAIIFGAIIVGGLILYMLSQSGGSASGAATATGPNALDLQQDAESSAASAQNSSQNFQLTAQTNQYGGQLALAQEGDATQIVLANTAAQVANAQNQTNAQISLAGIAAQLAGLENNNSTTISIANIAANENVGIAQINSTTELGIAGDQTKVALEQQKTLQQQSTNSAISGGLGALASILF